MAEAAQLRQRRYNRTPDPCPPRIQVLLKQAYLLKKRLDENSCLTRAALASEEGLDPSFLTRILNLLKLAPEIQEFILAMQPTSFQSPISERRVQHIARIPNHSSQIMEFDKLKTLFGRARIPSKGKTDFFFLRADPRTFPVDLGNQLPPTSKDLN